MGTVEVTGDQLQGVLQVGLKPEFLDWVPGSLEAVFTEQRDGLNWTTVRLSGTVQEPKEDLSKRILSAVEDRLGRDLRNRLKDTAKSLRDLFKHCPLARPWVTCVIVPTSRPSSGGLTIKF